MHRRKALAIAASGTAVLATAAAALAANLGLLAAHPASAGRLGAGTPVPALATSSEPTSAAEPPVMYVYEDIPVPGAASPIGTDPAAPTAAVDPAGAASPVTGTLPPGAEDDDWSQDDDSDDEAGEDDDDRGEDDDSVEPGDDDDD